MKRPLLRLKIYLVICCLLAVLWPRYSFGQPPPALIHLKFNEYADIVPANSGTVATVFTRSGGVPTSVSNNVPADIGGGYSFDFGTTPGNYYVESTAPVDALKNLTAFTLTGWINSKSNVAGSGGNRIISWINNGGEGVDLVYQSNGSLRLGVDAWPDGSPAFSSPNKVAANPSAPASNWVFFAVTYQSNGQVQFYFGNNTSDATLDVTRTYAAPGVTGSAIGKLAIGAFNDATRNPATYDRLFRGLIDDIQVRGYVLTLQDIIDVQRGAGRDLISPSAPSNLVLVSKTSNTVSLSWTGSTDNVGVSQYNIYNGESPSALGVVTQSTSLTLIDLTPNTTYVFSVKAADAESNLSLPSNSVTVTTAEPGGDQTPPAAPTNLTVVAKSQTTVTLSWSPSSDPDVAEQRLYRNDSLDSPMSSSLSTIYLSDLDPNTTYSYYVVAVDTAENVSAPSNTVTFTTNPAQELFPLIRLAFNETSGINNSGTVPAGFTRSQGLPAFSTNVPSGGGPNSIDFGTTPGNYFVQSLTPVDALKNLDAFTLTGWVNVKSNTAGSGGNRIISWINNGGEGVDLVYQSNGSLRLGVDGWPDNSPAFSSPAKVTTDASASAGNWVFFAVTYQANGQVQFYFGNNATDASFDVAKTYTGPGVTGSAINKLAIGAFNDGTRSPGTYDRMFRGLIDDIQVYGSVLTPTDIVNVQRSVGIDADTLPPSEPPAPDITLRTSTSISLEWGYANDNVRVARYIVSANNQLFYVTSPDGRISLTVPGLSPVTTYSFSVQAQDAAGNTSAPSPVVLATTLPSQSPLIRLALNEEAGASVTNSGSLNSQFTRSEPTPYSSNLGIPYLTTSVFGFGTTPGNNYVESSAVIDGLKNLSSFTLTGWINNNSATTGSGGNRIMSWINHGGDGVDLVYQSDGSLRLGVDGWPDSSPAFSSSGKITTVDVGIQLPRNWTFFAVTYQSNGQVQFYFGTPTAGATLDVTRTYSGPGVVGSNIGRLAIGNFNSATRSPATYDRMIRAFVDDMQIYGSVLSIQDILAVQGNTAPMPPPSQPMVAEEETEIKNELYQNYPNPYSDETEIGVSLLHSVSVARVTVIDVNGRALKNIEVVERGKTNVKVNGNDMNAGLYFYRLVVDGKVADTKRMVLTK